MEAYYGFVSEPRSETLPQVQLEMLEEGATRHPFYWANFVPIGAWSPVEFSRVARTR